MKTPTEDIKKRNHNPLPEFSDIAYQLAAPLVNQWCSFIFSLYAYTTKWSKISQYSLHDTIIFLLKVILFLAIFLNMFLIFLYFY